MTDRFLIQSEYIFAGIILVTAVKTDQKAAT